MRKKIYSKSYEAGLRGFSLAFKMTVGFGYLTILNFFWLIRYMSLNKKFLPECILIMETRRVLKAN
jgi:hypothetical protein